MGKQVTITKFTGRNAQMNVYEVDKIKFIKIIEFREWGQTASYVNLLAYWAKLHDDELGFKLDDERCV